MILEETQTPLTDPSRNFTISATPNQTDENPLPFNSLTLHKSQITQEETPILFFSMTKKKQLHHKTSQEVVGWAGGKIYMSAYDHNKIDTDK